MTSGVWGEPLGNTLGKNKKVEDAFTLILDTEANVWVAIFRMSIDVSKYARKKDAMIKLMLFTAFLRLPYQRPLLSLTVSITLRERPVLRTPARGPLVDLISGAGGIPVESTIVKDDGEDEEDRFGRASGLEEINLLDGLTGGIVLICTSAGSLSNF